ncbi:MAG: hypothetical protein NZ937_09870, partial [Armatimonadetes bacterium]|nr:hypothetical protein [Armatimonadota bacterium]
GTLYLGQNGVFENKANLQLKDNTYISTTDSQPGKLVNEGTVEKVEGNGTAYIHRGFENKSALKAMSGTISLGNALFLDGGEISAGNGVVLVPSGGRIEVAGNGTGYLRSGATLRLEGVLAGSGTLRVEGTMEWRVAGSMEGQGVTLIAQGGNLKMGTSGWGVTLRRTLRNEGNAVLEAGTLYLGQNGVFENKANLQL